MPESWASDAAVRAVMRANRGRDTKPELLVRRLVHAAGLRYRVNARPLSDSRATADLLFTKAKVAVFIDGCFWHGCPDHHRPSTKNAQFWRDKIEDNKERDTRTTRTLAAAGWTVVRAWEHEDPNEVATRVIRTVRGYAEPSQATEPT